MKEYGLESNGAELTESAVEREYLEEMGEWINAPKFLQDADIELCRPWLPHRCNITNRWLWWTPAIRARRTYLNIDSSVCYNEDHWYEAKAYLLYKLKESY